MTSSAGSLLIRDVHVLDVDRGEFLEHRDVLCVEGEIAQLADASSIESDAPVLEGGGRFLLPGYIDAHVHVAASTLDLLELARWPATYAATRAAEIMAGMLARGFTTVRDVSGGDHGLCRAQAEGLVAGPRLYFGGKAIGPTGGHSDIRDGAQYQIDDHPGCSGLGRIADGVAEARYAARDELRKGADHLKVMASGGIASPADRIDSLQFSREELCAIVEEATNANRYVAAHAYTAPAVNRALECGIRSIEHGNLIDDSSIELLLRHEAYLVPTLVAYRAILEDGPGLGFPDVSLSKAAGVFDRGLAAFESAVRAEVQVGFGTDLLGAMHPRQLEEFEIRGAICGPLAVLRSAMTVNAELIGNPRLGRVADGMIADLVIVEQDPLTDIRAVSDAPPWRVVQSGRIVAGEGSLLGPTH